MHVSRAIYIVVSLVLTVVVAVPFAHAEMSSGWAFLAAESKRFPHNKCGEFAKASPRPFLAVLADSFGKSRKCLRRFMRQSQGKNTYFQYYAGNGSGRRKTLRSYEFLHDLDKHEYNRKLCDGDRSVKRTIVNQARRLRKRCEKYAHEEAQCLISPELESQFTECAINKWVEYAKKAGWKKKQIVHNPVNIGPYQGRGDAGILERHWVFNKSAEKSYHLGVDGACADHCGGCGITGSRVQDDQILQWHTDNKDRRNQYFSLWCPEHQGLYEDSGTAPEPRKRRIRVSQSSFDSGNKLIGAILKPEPKKHYLKRCKVIKDFQNGNIAKESEHGGFVAVTLDIFENARLIDPSGKKYSLNYTGIGNPYHGRERHHYRHNQNFNKFPDNMILRGKVNGEATCFKLYKSGERHE